MELSVNLDKLLIVQNQETVIAENNPTPQFQGDEGREPANSANNPPWNSGIAFVTWIVSIAFILIVPSIAVIIYLAANHIDLSNMNALSEKVNSDPNIILLNIIAIIPAHFLTILVAWMVVTRVRKYSFREMLGWELGRFSVISTVGYMTAIVVGFFVIAVFLTSIFGDPDNQLTLILKSSRTAVYVIAFLATFTAPFVEEVVYRGILYSAFQRTFGVPSAIFLVTVLFAGVHFIQYWGSTGTLIMICLLSLTLTMIRVKTENLLPCIILHTILNGIQAIGMVASTFVKDPPTSQAPDPLFIINLLR